MELEGEKDVAGSCTGLFIIRLFVLGGRNYSMFTYWWMWSGMGETLDKKLIAGQIFAQVKESWMECRMKALVAGTQMIFICTRESSPWEHRCGIGGLGRGECRDSLLIASTCLVKYKGRSLYLGGATPRCYKGFSLIWALNFFSFLLLLQFWFLSNKCVIIYIFS